MNTGKYRHFDKLFCSMSAFLLILVLQPSTHAATSWMESSLSATQRANLLLAAMTQEEKLLMVHGKSSRTYVGEVPANARLGIPALNLQDGPAGVSAIMGQVTAFPSPSMVAGSWDIKLMKRYASTMAAEIKGKGANVHLAPMMNINRIPQSGRNFEGYGEDPFLSSRMAEASVLGIQGQGIIATAKHYINNEQEIERNFVSADIDARTLHEIYLPPFKASVQAGVGSIMCAYNKINGVYACENETTQNKWLKRELGFQGWIMSDWWATHSTVASANNGLDMEQPDPNFFGTTLATAIDNGQVSKGRLDDMVRRILIPMFQIGLFDNAPTGSQTADVQSPEHTQVARDGAAQGMVLLKNLNNVLPINTSNIRSIAVIGSAAHTAPIVVGGGSGNVRPPYVISPLQGISNRAGGGITVRYVQGDSGAGVPIPNQYLKTPSGAAGLQGQYYNNTSIAGSPVLSRIDPNLSFGFINGSPGAGVNEKNWSARWSGSLTPPTSGSYTLFLSSDDGSRLYVNGSLAIDNWGDHGNQTKSATLDLIAGQAYSIEVQYYQGGGESSLHLGWNVPGSTPFSAATSLARESDIAIVVVGLSSSEGSDRPNLSLPNDQDELVSAVSGTNPRTIVVAYTPGQILMPWANQVQGILLGGMPGQEGGNALASLLFGDVNPSGKLPMTLAKNTEDYPAQSPEQYPGVNLRAAYSEGSLVGYRHFDSANIAPLFPFGHGLSYTTFSYSDLIVNPVVTTPASDVSVSVNITNTGSRAGEEVAQLYLAFPHDSSEPPKQLKGFEKIALQPGQSQRVTFKLSPELFSFWSAGSESWVVHPGSYQVMVGSSSRDIRQSASFQVRGGTLAGFVYQAEAAVLGGGASIAENHSGYSGTGFVDHFTSVGASTSFHLNAPSTGAYRVSLRYANGIRRTGTISIYVNGVKVRQTDLPQLANWEMWDYKTESLYLNAGHNTVTYQYDNGDSGHVNLDSIIFNSSPNLALNKLVTASSFHNDNNLARYAVDPYRRWSSAFSDPQWIQVDLGATQTISSVLLKWKGGHARTYQIQTSNDGLNWTTISSTTTGDGSLDEWIGLTGSGRFVRVNATVQGSDFGISLGDLEVYGPHDPSAVL